MINSAFPSSIATDKEAYHRLFGKSVRLGIGVVKRPTVITEHDKCYFPTLCHITFKRWGTPELVFGEVKDWMESTPMTHRQVIDLDKDLSLIAIRTNPVFEYNARRI